MAQHAIARSDHCASKHDVARVSNRVSGAATGSWLRRLRSHSYLLTVALSFYRAFEAEWTWARFRTDHILLTNLDPSFARVRPTPKRHVLSTPEGSRGSDSRRDIGRADIVCAPQSGRRRISWDRAGRRRSAAGRREPTSRLRVLTMPISTPSASRSSAVEHSG